MCLLAFTLYPSLGSACSVSDNVNHRPAVNSARPGLISRRELARRTIKHRFESISSGASRGQERRPGSAGRSEIRILFAFDTKRRAILLVAGDKADRWKQWYQENIPVVDDRFDEWLKRE